VIYVHQENSLQTSDIVNLVKPMNIPLLQDLVIVYRVDVEKKPMLNTPRVIFVHQARTLPKMKPVNAVQQERFLRMQALVNVSLVDQELK